MTKKILHRSLYTIFILLLFAGVISAQDNNLFMSSDKDLFYIDPIVFYTAQRPAGDSAKGRLDLYIEVPKSNLLFTKNLNTDIFESNIEYTVVIQNSKKTNVINNSYSENIKSPKDKLKETSEESAYFIKNYNLPADAYTVSFTLHDRGSGKELSKQRKCLIRDNTSRTVYLSDAMILSDYREDNAGKKVLTPLVNNNVGNFKEFYFFYEIYSLNENPAPQDFKYKITDLTDKPLVEGSFSYTLQTGINKKIEKLSAANLIIGDYILKILDAKSNEVLSEKLIEFKWTGMPISVKDLTSAIDQLIYIANSDELDKIKKAKTNAEKQMEFIKFWRSKAPNPNSSRNEVMIEYYNRIRVANERYKHYYKEGWKTDMGMVYVIYGEPSSIERSGYGDSPKPYEIWEYYDIKQRFTFIDDSGFGDYRLITPIWDKTATRLRY